MNMIIEAMLYNEHVTVNDTLLTGTWKKFNKEIKNKNLIVFGVGKAADTIVNTFLKKQDIYCYLDNDVSKQGKRKNGVSIRSPKEISSQIFSESVVLITSTVYMDEIARQLDDLGVKNYYSVLAMESKRIKNKAVVCCARFVLYKLCPIQKKKIVLLNRPDRYFCNLKYVAQALHNKYPSYRLIWLTNQGNEEFPQYIKKVRNTKLSLLYHVATAKVWLFNDNQHRGVQKRKGQFFVNVWHGCVALKRIGIYTNQNSNKMILDVVETSKKTDLFISNGQWCSNMYRTSFKYEGKILEVGTPRLDVLFRGNSRIEQEIRERFHIPSNGKVIMYSPTFRSVAGNVSDDMGAYLIDFVAFKDSLQKAYGTEVYILLRLHPAISSAAERLRETTGIINVTQYSDIYELLLITDTVITDYSSVMFEASYVKKKVFLYATDIEHYKIDDRGFYFDYYSLPYPVATSVEELINNILTLDYDKIQHNIDLFIHNELQIVENGSASERVADIINLLNKYGVEKLDGLV